MPGVAAAAPIGELTLTATVDTELTDLSLWGVDLAGPRQPRAHRAKAGCPAPAKSWSTNPPPPRASRSERPSPWFRAEPNSTIVGYVQDRRYAVVATAYLDFDQWVDIFEAEFPGSPIVPLSMIGVEIAAGRGPDRRR